MLFNECYIILDWITVHIILTLNPFEAYEPFYVYHFFTHGTAGLVVVSIISSRLYTLYSYHVQLLLCLCGWSSGGIHVYGSRCVCLCSSDFSATAEK